MYALIDTQYRNTQSRGRILSRHRTVEAAKKANTKQQRDVRNGKHSYLPTIICEQSESVRGGRRSQRQTECTFAYRSDWTQVDPETGEPVES